MRKGETKGTAKLRYLVWTKVDEKKYTELADILAKTKDETMSSAVRKILYNKPIKVYVRDETTNLLLEELAALRSEIKAIGINFNQITKYFNTYKEDEKRKFYAKIGFEKYAQLESKVTKLLEIMSTLCSKWLSG